MPSLSLTFVSWLQGAVVLVGTGGEYPTITAGLAAAHPGDTVRVTAGVYREHPVITAPVVLLGDSGAVIDGNGDGTVITIHASAVVSGFTIQNSGSSQSEEHSGLLAERASGLVIEDNVFRDVLFGIYVKQSHAPVVRRNHIQGKAVAIPLRGDGIRLWQSRAASITDNVVRDSRDVVIWFSDSARVLDNRVHDSRYGLHYMYSNHTVFERNEFVGNEVGAFLMYSTDITFRNNTFADARGTMGRGLGFKDADRITAEGNVLVKNAIGISIDNSPHSQGVINRFSANVVAFNDIGVMMLPSVKANTFQDNTFQGNVLPVVVSGGGTALGNSWGRNYWSDYAGFDADHDGIGDTPFVHERLSDDLFAKHEALRIFQLSIGATALNMLSHVFPLLEPTAIVVDSTPRTRPLHHDPSKATVALHKWWLLLVTLAAFGMAVRIHRKSTNLA